MKSIRFIVCLITASIACAGCGNNGNSTSPDFHPVPKGEEFNAPEGYSLVWHDEFDADGRPSDDWTYEHGFVRNMELQWYQPDNASVKDGCLLIEGRKERIPNPGYKEGSHEWRENREFAEYTSTCLTTRGKVEFRYGRLEVRARIPVAPGSWPAIWTLGNMWGWPANGEVDLMEYYVRNGNRYILANACWSSETGGSMWDEGLIPYSHFTDMTEDWADRFHIWRMDWDKDFIRLYLDDELLNEIDLSLTANRGANGNFNNPFSNDIEGFGQYILLNLAIGSNGGTPDDTAFPLRYEIDYVRLFQKNL